MDKYVYDGPVKSFGEIVNSHWHGETIAPTFKKAISNLSYHYKKEHNRDLGSKIELSEKNIIKI